MECLSFLHSVPSVMTLMAPHPGHPAYALSLCVYVYSDVFYALGIPGLALWTSASHWAPRNLSSGLTGWVGVVSIVRGVMCTMSTPLLRCSRVARCPDGMLTVIVCGHCGQDRVCIGMCVSSHVN